MMDAKEFLMIGAKECRRCGSCCDCKFFNEGYCTWRAIVRDDDDEQLEQRVDRAISIAEKLSHVKTYADDFFEKFPNAPKEPDGSPIPCRDFVYGTKSTRCMDGMDGCCQCWNEPYEESKMTKENEQ